MIRLKFMLSVLILLVVTLKASSQSEQVIFPNISNMEVSGKEFRKAQSSISAVGVSFTYDTINSTLLLHLHNPKYLPGFLSKKNFVELNVGDHILTLSEKEIEQQLIDNYLKNIFPIHDEVYRGIFSRKGLDSAQIVDIHKIDNARHHFLHYKKELSRFDVSSKTYKSLKKDLGKKFSSFSKDYRSFQKVLNSKSNQLSLLDNRYGSYTLIFNDVPKGDFILKFFSRGQLFSTLHFDTLLGSPADFLPQSEITNCIPFNRYTYFKTIKGIGLQRFHFPPYQPLSKLVGYKDFTIYFDQNSSGCSMKDIQMIHQLLNDSSYTIRKAKIFAYASIEGDVDNNIRLQKERAQILIDLLQANNKDSIEIAEFHTDENWEMFYDQIKNTSLNDWADSTRTWIKSQFKDPVLAIRWKGMLAEQRKAVLQLQLYQDTDINSQIKHAIKEYRSLSSYFISLHWNQRKSEDPRIVANQLKLLSIDDFLKRMVRSGNMTMEEYAGLYNYQPSALDVLRFYSMMLDDAKNLPNIYLNKENIIIRAYNSVLNDLYSDNLSTFRQNYLLRQAIDMQIYAFEQIDEGKLPAELLCRLDWPDKKVYYPLILNELDYVNKQPRELIANLGCYRTDSMEQSESEIHVERKNKRNGHAISFTLPLDYKIPHSSYYFFLKKRLLHNDQDIRKLVVRSDDYMEFDLYDVLAHNILYWDVWNNRYYDDDVDYTKMIQLMDKLIANNKILCTRQLYQLYLDLHLRVSYLLRHDNHPRISKEVLSSLTKLQKYYIKNISQLSKEDGLKLVDHLIWMGKYYYANETLDLATELLLKMDE